MFAWLTLIVVLERVNFLAVFRHSDINQRPYGGDDVAHSDLSRVRA
jgi:hypothetical protein